MARKVFYIYIFFSISIAILAVTTNFVKVPYGYDKILSLKNIAPYIISILVGVFFFYFGYRLILNGKEESPINSRAIFKKALKFDSNTLLLIFVIQVLLLIYFIYISYESVRNAYPHTYELYRPIYSKASVPILFIQAMFPLVLSRQRVFFAASIVCCIVISFLIAWVNASRSAVIPFLGVIYFLASHKRFRALWLSIFQAFNCYALALVARSINNRFSFEGLVYLLENTLDNYFTIIISTITYTSAFSVLHFSFVLDGKFGTFPLYDLVYSIFPVPSFLWPGEIPDYSNWRVDYYRPMGALAEVSTYSSVAMYLLFFVYGLVAKSVDTISNNLLKIAAIIVFFATIIILFQYNMRTLMWFLYLLVFIRILDTGFFKRLKLSSQ